MRLVRGQWFALLVALLMLLPGGAAARSLFYCQMMGHVVSSCCCRGEGGTGLDASRAVHRATNSEATNSDCCQRLTPGERAAALSVHHAVPDLAALAVSRALPEVALPGMASVTDSVCDEATQAPLAIGPPLFVLHCALLS